MRRQRRRICALVVPAILVAGPAHASAVRQAVEPTRRLALFVGNDATADRLRELSKVLVQSFGYVPPVELYGRAATQEGIRAALSTLAESATPRDSLTVVVGLANVRLARDDPFGQFLLPADGNPDQPWTLLPVGELEKFLGANGRAATTLLVLPQCPSPIVSQSAVCPYTSQERAITTLSVCPGARGEEHLMARFVEDGAKALTAFAADAGGAPRRATVPQILSASKEGYQAEVRQCPTGAEPFTFVAAQDRLAFARATLDHAVSPDDRVKGVERLVDVASTEPSERAASSIAVAVDRLAGLLFDTSEPPAVRSRAAWGLGRLKYPSQAVLDRMLDLIADGGETNFVRVSAIDALASLGHPAAVAALKASLGRPGTREVAPEVVGALARLRDASSLPLIIDMAATGDERARVVAFTALPVFAVKNDPQSAEFGALQKALTSSMAHPEASVRRAALTFVGSTGSFGTAGTILLRLLPSDPDPAVREAAAYAIGRSLERKEIGEKDRQLAAVRLLEASQKPPNEVRAAAVWSLGHVGGTRAEERLIDLVRNARETTSIRSAAAEALGLMRSERGVPALAEALLRPGEVKLRTAAADALGAIGSRAAADVLLKALADEKAEAQVRSAAQRAMESIKPASASVARLNDPSAAVRLETVRLIGEAKDPSLAVRLIEKLNDPDSDVREAALVALGPLADESSIVQALGTTLASDPDALRRVGAVRVLASGKTPVARASLIAALDDASPAVRATAAEALVRQAVGAGGTADVPPDVSMALRRSATDAHTSVRLSSARAMGTLRDPESEEILKKMTQDASPEVREAAFDSLARRTRSRK